MKILTILLVLSFTACGSAGKAGSGSGSFLSCEKVDLSQMVGDHTLIDTVVAELAKHDYVNAIESLITRVGSDAVGCAIVAIGEAKTMTPATAASPPVRARARELADAHGWRTP